MAPVNRKGGGRKKRSEQADSGVKRPRYKKPRGPHRPYMSEELQDAVHAVKEEGMSIREASVLFGIPKSTLHDRVTGAHGIYEGHQTVLTREEEEMITDRLKYMATWGFPLTTLDLRNFIKSYLDKKGATTEFKDNMPGRRYGTSTVIITGTAGNVDFGL